MKNPAQVFVSLTESARIAACRREVLEAAQALDQSAPAPVVPCRTRAKPAATLVNPVAIPFGSEYLRMRENGRERANSAKRKILVALALLDIAVIAWSCYQILPLKPPVPAAARADR